MIRLFHALFACAALVGGACAQAAPDHVDITWMSIANMHFDLGDQQIVADGYITRLPPEIFYSGASGYGKTQRAARPDEAAVKEVLRCTWWQARGEASAHGPQPFRSFVRYRHLGEVIRRARDRCADRLPADARARDCRQPLHVRCSAVKSSNSSAASTCT